MVGLRYHDIAHRDNEFMDLTSLTQEEFGELLPAFERAFQEQMQQWNLDGTPRIGRGFVAYANSPLPTPHDRLLFVLMYVKTNAFQVVHGRMFGLPQNKANQWIHTLLPVLQAAFPSLGDTPARSMGDLARRLPPHVGPLSTAPLFVMMEPSDESPVRRTRRNKRARIAGRKNAIQ